MSILLKSSRPLLSPSINSSKLFEIEHCYAIRFYKFELGNEKSWLRTSSTFIALFWEISKFLSLWNFFTLPINQSLTLEEPLGQMSTMISDSKPPWINLKESLMMSSISERSLWLRFRFLSCFSSIKDYFLIDRAKTSLFALPKSHL